MNINKTRGLLYKIARILGDVQATKNGTIGKRMIRRAAGKATGRRRLSNSTRQPAIAALGRALDGLQRRAEHATKRQEEDLSEQ